MIRSNALYYAVGALLAGIIGTGVWTMQESAAAGTDLSMLTAGALLGDR